MLTLVTFHFLLALSSVFIEPFHFKLFRSLCVCVCWRQTVLDYHQQQQQCYQNTLSTTTTITASNLPLFVPRSHAAAAASAVHQCSFARFPPRFGRYVLSEQC